jgi:hypothetical protein
VDKFEFPDTDSPEVMQQAISFAVAQQIWDLVSRLERDEEHEEKFLALYHRVYASVKQAHQG